MSSATTLLGAWGEEQVAHYLRKRGYRLISRNFRCRGGEIDLILTRGDLLCFVEVKLRKDDHFASALEQVTPAKQQRIRTTAALYLAQHPEVAEYRCRFDVAEVYAPEGAQTRRADIRYCENAFW